MLNWAVLSICYPDAVSGLHESGSRVTQRHTKTTLGRVSCSPELSSNAHAQVTICQHAPPTSTRLHKPRAKQGTVPTPPNNEHKKEGLMLSSTHHIHRSQAYPTQEQGILSLDTHDTCETLSAPSELLLQNSGAVLATFFGVGNSRTRMNVHTWESQTRSLSHLPPKKNTTNKPANGSDALQAKNQIASSHTQGNLDIAKQGGTRCLKTMDQTREQRIIQQRIQPSTIHRTLRLVSRQALSPLFAWRKKRRLKRRRHNARRR